MKALFALPGSLALSAFLLTAHAQAPVTAHDNPTPAKPAKPAKGARESKTLGQKMVEKSKPTDTRLRIPPVKQQ